MKVLFTSPVMEYPAAGGPQLRIETSIKALSRVCELDVVAQASLDEIGGPEGEKFYRGLCREFHILHSNKKKYRSRLLHIAQKITQRLFGRQTERDAQFLIRHVERKKIDVLWFGYGNISFPLMKRIKELKPDLKIVCDTDSVWSRFILRRLPYASGLRRLWIAVSGRRKEKEEAVSVNLCDITTAVSEVDADYYRSIAKDPNRVKIFSNVIDVASYAVSQPPPPKLHKPAIYLAGTFGHYNSPMDTAARWVLEEVLPLVRKQRPDVHFYIVGNRSDLMFGHIKDPNITVTGKLPSVLPYLFNIDVALVPLKFESGTRFKILEAGACRTALVSTTLGAEGIPVINNEHILIGDDPETFAAAIIRLINDKDLATRLAANCYDLVCRNYSVEALQRQATLILDSLKA